MITEFLGRLVGYVLPELTLLLVGFFVEKYYVSRVTVLTNSTAIVIHVLSASSPGTLTGLYADFGLALGIWGFLHYLFEESNGDIFRVLSFFLYSSTNVGILILSNSLLYAVVGGALIQLVLAILVGADQLSYFGPYSFDVKYFIENKSIPLYDPEVQRNIQVGLTNYFDT